MSQLVTVKSTGLSVDLILFRAYGVAGRSLIKATYDDNPGLAEVDGELPIGTSFVMPDRPKATSVVTKRVSLFG